jgi:hypothetical protein
MQEPLCFSTHVVKRALMELVRIDQFSPGGVAGPLGLMTASSDGTGDAAIAE